jgi:hypothetical protein
VIHLRRGRSWVAAFLAVAACGAAVAAPAVDGPASAEVTAAGPASVPAGPGCPATMRAWVPSATALASGDPQAVAPGNLSPQTRTEFGRQVLRLLAGHRVRWLGDTGCGHVHAYSGARADSAAGARAALHGTEAASPPAISPNWSGFESDLGNFTGASMTWTVPSVGPASAPAGVSIWPGIGTGSETGNNDSLVQAGTAQDAGGATYAWTEVYPQEDEQIIKDLSVSVGDKMAVNVGWDPATHTASFLVTDGSTAKEITQVISGSSGSSAEWIVERPGICDATCIIRPLLNIGTMAVTDGAAEQTINGKTTGGYIGSFSDHYSISMTNCIGDTTLASVPTGTDNLGDFTSTWKAAGPQDPDSPGPEGGACTWSLSPASAPFDADLASNATAVLYDQTAKLSITCSQGTLSGTTSPSPQLQVGSPATLVTITKSGFDSCTDQQGNVWSAAQTSGSAWDIRGDASSLDAVMTGDISGTGGGVAADVSGSISGKSCKFQLSGTVPSGDLTFTNPDTLNITSASLTVGSVSGAACGTVDVRNGDTVTLSALFTSSTLNIDT